MRTLSQIRGLLLSCVLVTVPLTLKSQTFSVSTDLLSYADHLSLDAGLSAAVARRWTVNAEFRYNPFLFGEPGKKQFSARQRMVQVGVRRWFWHAYSGWWLGGGLRCQEFNRTERNSSRTREGLRSGASLAGGYSYMLTPWMNIELASGLWAGYERYSLFECPVCGRRLEEGERLFILPCGLMLNLSFIF